jgi:hypothetical protein
MPVEFNCDFCGKLSEKSPSHMNEENNYCSRSCGNKDMSADKPSVKCNYCGEEFEVTPSRYNQSDNFYCNKKCETKWRNENAKYGEDNHNYERIDTECDYCGESISVIKWEYNNYDHNFCDNKCSYDWRSENIKGENHPNYKDGSAPKKYPREFYRMRDDVLDKYSQTCLVCGMDDKEHRKKYNKGICVHHIDGDVDNNELSNLVVLCQTCNSRVEHMQYRPDKKELKNKNSEELFS